MTELPGTEWRASPWSAPEALAYAPMDVAWQAAGQVRHGFTHFELTIDLFAARVERIEADGFHCPVTALAHEALHSVMRKCVRMARSAQPSAGPARETAADRGPPGTADPPTARERHSTAATR